MPHWTGSAGATLKYIGDRAIAIVGTGAPQTFMSSYTALDLHVGVTRDDWLFNLYANNVTDRIGVIEVKQPLYRESIIRPRVIGLTVTRAF